MDNELEKFEDWCNDHAFELYEKAITHNIDTRVRGIWQAMPEHKSEFEIITILGTKVEVTGIIGMREYNLTNLKINGAYRKT